VIKRFDFTNSNIGDLAGFMGICWALGSWITNHLLIRYFSQLKILEVVILIFTILCGLIAIPVDKILLLCILGSCVIIGGIAWPLCSSIISNRAPSNIQGKILGISQSMQSLAMGISPIIGGIANGVSIYFPFVIASFSCLIAGIIYFNLRPKEP
jgi:MFS family permease